MLVVVITFIIRHFYNYYYIDIINHLIFITVVVCCAFEQKKFYPVLDTQRTRLEELSDVDPTSPSWTQLGEIHIKVSSQAVGSCVDIYSPSLFDLATCGHLLLDIWRVFSRILTHLLLSRPKCNNLPSIPSNRSNKHYQANKNTT